MAFILFLPKVLFDSDAVKRSTLFATDDRRAGRRRRLLPTCPRTGPRRKFASYLCPFFRGSTEARCWTDSLPGRRDRVRRDRVVRAIFDWLPGCREGACPAWRVWRECAQVIRPANDSWAG